MRLSVGRDPLTDAERMDRARLTKRDIGRRVPGDAWVRDEGAVWHMVEAAGGATFVAQCEAEVPSKTAAFGLWRIGHWPKNSCHSCIGVMKATRERIDLNYKPPADPLSQAVDRWFADAGTVSVTANPDPPERGRHSRG